MRKKHLLALLLAAPGVPALAAEGRTPVFLPGSVLAADGNYVVTRNLVASTGPAITICGADVDLDLNGMVVSTNDINANVITTVGCPGGGADHVSIRNGFIAGGQFAIEVLLARKVDIEDVKIHDVASMGVYLEDVEGAAIRRVEVTDAESGIRWDNSAGFTTHGTIEHNLLRRVRNGGISVSGGSGLAVLNNRIQDSDIGAGIFLYRCDATLVAENTIDRAEAGIVLSFGRGNTLRGNVVLDSDSDGIGL
jgi:parallel beta-helix repeat protein